MQKDAQDEITQHKNLLIKITQRGPTAFTVFKGICETDFTEAAEILKQRPVQANGPTFLSISKSKQENERERKEMYEGKGMSKLRPGTSRASTSNVNGNTNKDTIRLEQYNGPIPRQLDVQRATKFSTASLPGIETYQMQSRHRGVLFLVNIIDFHDKDKRRNGAELDKDRLLDLFDQMGFKLFYYENITSDQFNSLIKQLSSSDYLRMADCLVFGLLTHGSL